MPKCHVRSLLELEPELGAHLLAVVQDVARRVVDRHGGCQVLTTLGDEQHNRHLHFHVAVGEGVARFVPVLVAPSARLHTEWLEAHHEWGPGVHEDGFGLRASDEIGSLGGFAAWVARLVGDPGCTYRWIVGEGRVLGGIALRHGSGEGVELAGHIGYGIRPSARRRGLASWAVGEMLDEARKFGIGRVLVVCAADNIASARTIERNGGVLEGIRDTRLGAARRYWIDTGRPRG